MMLRRSNVKLKTGFNHRYSHQTWKAHELLRAGAIGDILFIRGRTGHRKNARGKVLECVCRETGHGSEVMRNA